MARCIQFMCAYASSSNDKQAGSCAYLNSSLKRNITIIVLGLYKTVVTVCIVILCYSLYNKFKNDLQVMRYNFVYLFLEVIIL